MLSMENQKYCCSLCQLDFTTSSNLRKHERTEKHIKIVNKIESEKVEEKQMSIKDLELQVVELKTILSEVLERMKVMESLLVKNNIASLPPLEEVKIEVKKKTPKRIQRTPEVNPVESILEPESEPIPILVPEPEIQVNPIESKVEKPKRVKKVKPIVIPLSEIQVNPTESIVPEPEKVKTLGEAKRELRTLLDNTSIGCCKSVLDEYFPQIQRKYRQVMMEWYQEYYETRLTKNTIVYEFKQEKLPK